MTVAVGSDHAGFQLKEILAKYLRDHGYDVIDVGTHSEDRVDYPFYGAAVGRLVASGKAARGVLACGSGAGICIAANKIRGIRAGAAHDVESARLLRAHNDAQVICFGGRNTAPDLAVSALEVFLTTDFEGGRHAARVAQLNLLDEEREARG